MRREGEKIGLATRARGAEERRHRRRTRPAYAVCLIRKENTPLSSVDSSSSLPV
jgi:hypothetical protein